MKSIMPLESDLGFGDFCAHSGAQERWLVSKMFGFVRQLALKIKQTCAEVRVLVLID